MRVYGRLFLLASIVTATVTVLGCSEQEQTDELLVLCGTSFVTPMEALKTQYEQETEQKLALSFGGSEDLLPHVKLKAKGDLFITHDNYMDETEKCGAMLRWVHVGDMAPVLVVPKGNPKGIQQFEDLAKPGLKVILPNPEFSTCGEMVFELLEKKGIKDPVVENVDGAMFRSHSDIGNKMKLGFGDVAVMWNAVAHNYPDTLEIVPTEYEYDRDIRVGIIGLSYSKQTEHVEEFLKYVDSHGKEIFTQFGYVK